MDPHITIHSVLCLVKLEDVVAGADLVLACSAVVPGTAVTTGVTDLLASSWTVAFKEFCVLGKMVLQLLTAELTDLSKLSLKLRS